MDEPPKGLERRLVYRVLMRWRDAQEDDNIPSLEAVSRQNFSDIWPDVFILSNVDGDGEPVFERIGDSFTDEGGTGLIGKPVSETPKGTLIEQGLAYYKKVIEKGVPITHDDEFVNGQGQTIQYRSVILPLCDTPNTITRLMCAANGKVKEDSGNS